MSEPILSMLFIFRSTTASTHKMLLEIILARLINIFNLSTSIQGKLRWGTTLKKLQIKHTMCKKFNVMSECPAAFSQKNCMVLFKKKCNGFYNYSFNSIIIFNIYLFCLVNTLRYVMIAMPITYRLCLDLHNFEPFVKFLWLYTFKVIFKECHRRIKSVLLCKGIENKQKFFRFSCIII